MTEDLPVPISNPDSQPYWEGARAGRLMLKRCRACTKVHFLPRFLCPHCWSQDLEWFEASGRGTVHSFTVIRRAPAPAFAQRVPYVLALIDLEEGVRLMANVLGKNALDTQIGDEVTVFFEERGDNAKLPQFVRVR